MKTTPPEAPGKVLHLSPLKWLKINIKNKNGVVKLGILSTSKNVAIKKTRLHKTHDTTTTEPSVLFTEVSVLQRCP